MPEGMPPDRRAAVAPCSGAGRRAGLLCRIRGKGRERREEHAAIGRPDRGRAAAADGPAVSGPAGPGVPGPGVELCRTGRGGGSDGPAAAGLGCGQRGPPGSLVRGGAQRDRAAVCGEPHRRSHRAAEHQPGADGAQNTSGAQRHPVSGDRRWL